MPITPALRITSRSARDRSTLTVGRVLDAVAGRVLDQQALDEGGCRDRQVGSADDPGQVGVGGAPADAADDVALVPAGAVRGGAVG